MAVVLGEEEKKKKKKSKEDDGEGIVIDTVEGEVRAMTLLT